MPRYDLEVGANDGLDAGARRVLNLVEYTKASGSSYSAAAYDGAYYTIELAGAEFTGQRNPGQRFAGVPFDFHGKTVLDVGCNQGGMLFHIAGQISHGIGIDYDHRMINAANRLRRYRDSSNLDFYVFDLEKEELSVIDNFLDQPRVDVVLLLSVCMWISNWRQVIHKMASISDAMIFESNGTNQQQADQEDVLRNIYASVQKIRESSEDDPNQRQRRLFFCTGARV